MNASKKVILVFFVIALCAASAFAGYAFLKEPKAKVFAYSSGNYFVTNITDSRCLLKSDLIIEVTNKKYYTELARNTHRVRDAIINILRSKSYDEMKNPNIQNILKLEIKNRVCEKLTGVTIADIYFNEFVIQ